MTKLLVVLLSTLFVAGCATRVDPVEHSSYGKMGHTDERYVNDFYDCLVDLAPTEEERAKLQVERDKVSLKFMALVNSIELANATGIRNEDVETVNVCLTDKGWTQFRNK